MVIEYILSGTRLIIAFKVMVMTVFVSIITMKDRVLVSLNRIKIYPILYAHVSFLCSTF